MTAISKFCDLLQRFHISMECHGLSYPQLALLTIFWRQEDECIQGCTKRLYKKGGEGKTRPLKTKEQMLKQHRTAQVVETAFQSISQGQPTCSSPTRQPILRHEKQEGKRRLHTTCTSSHESNVHKRKSRETQCAPQPCTKAAQLWGPGSPVASNAALRVRPFCEDKPGYTGHS